LSEALDAAHTAAASASRGAVIGPCCQPGKCHGPIGNREEQQRCRL